MKWQFPIVFWEFVKQSRADCWTSFSPYRLRAGQPGTWVYMRFPSGKVCKRGCTVTIVTKRCLLSYPYLKIDMSCFFPSLLGSFFLILFVDGNSYKYYASFTIWCFSTKSFSLSLLSSINIRSFWILSPPLCLLKNKLNSNTRGPGWNCSSVLVLLESVYKPVWHIPVPSVQWINSWWWAEELPEKGRVSCRSKFWKFVHLVGFVTKKPKYQLA